MSARTLMLLRHGEIPPGYRGRYVGRTDPALDETGRRQAAGHREAFAAGRPELLCCSPLRRARESAALALPGYAVRYDERLREIDFGDWENLSFAEIEARAPAALLAVWAERPAEMAFPGGESFSDFARRVDDFTAELLALPARRLAVVAHGGVLRRMLWRLAGRPETSQFGAPPPRGSLTVLQLDSEGNLL